jgi:hypothetical protein
MKRAILAVAACAVLWPLGAAAQTVNPRVLEFFPSPDHNARLADGRPAVTSYSFELYQADAARPFQTVNLGKPSPQADGIIRYDFSSQIAAWPLPGGTYEARVAAVGPLGSGRSDASNRFTLATTARRPNAPTGVRIIR